MQLGPLPAHLPPSLSVHLPLSPAHRFPHRMRFAGVTNAHLRFRRCQHPAHLTRMRTAFVLHRCSTVSSPTGQLRRVCCPQRSEYQIVDHKTGCPGSAQVQLESDSTYTPRLMRAGKRFLDLHGNPGSLSGHCVLGGGKTITGTYSQGGSGQPGGSWIPTIKLITHNAAEPCRIAPSICFWDLGHSPQFRLLS